MAKTRYDCGSCERWFTSKIGRSNHISFAHTVRECRVCGPYDGYLGAHLAAAHPEMVTYFPELGGAESEIEYLQRVIRELRWELIALRPQPREVEYV